MKFERTILGSATCALGGEVKLMVVVVVDGDMSVLVTSKKDAMSQVTDVRCCDH